MMAVVGSRLFAELLVLGLTLAKTLQAYREATKLNIRAPLTEFLVRDGKCTA